MTSQQLQLKIRVDLYRMVFCNFIICLTDLFEIDILRQLVIWHWWLSPFIRFIKISSFLTEHRLIFKADSAATCRIFRDFLQFLRAALYIYIYTGCPRRNVPDFGRVFLMLKYTDITQNTYVQS